MWDWRLLRGRLVVLVLLRLYSLSYLSLLRDLALRILMLSRLSILGLLLLGLGLELILRGLSILLGLLWRRLDSLVSLRIETRIHGRLCVSKLLPSLQWCVLCLLPRRNIRRRRNVYAWHRVGVRRHVRLHALTSEGRRNVRRLLLVRTEDGVGRLLGYGGR